MARLAELSTLIILLLTACASAPAAPQEFRISETQTPSAGAPHAPVDPVYSASGSAVVPALPPAQPDGPPRSAEGGMTPEEIADWVGRVSDAGAMWQALSKCEPRYMDPIPQGGTSDQAWQAALPFLSDSSTRSCITKTVLEEVNW